MNRAIQIIAFFGLLIGIVGSVRALDYVWLTEIEWSWYGNRIMFVHGDTLDGPVHSNGQIAIAQDPVFYGQVSTTWPHFGNGGGSYNPQFLGPPPRFNAPRVNIQYEPQNVHNGAAIQGHFYQGAGYHHMIRFDGNQAKMYRWPRGTVEDSTDNWIVELTDRTCIFVNGPVRVKGLVSGRVTVGSAELIEIDDDIRYVDADPLTGETPSTSPNILALVSEGDIKIRNTFANGRENSGGSGNDQTNRDSTSVVITAALYALGGSFTFENQNDPDSGYVCNCYPDDRGAIYLFGGVAQQRRGYLHRSTRSSTGYRLNLRYDPRFQIMKPPCTPEVSSIIIEAPDTLDFGDVPVGITAWDTAFIHTNETYLGSVYANYPFYPIRQMPFQGNHFVIPTRFTPPQAGVFTGILYVSFGREFLNIVLRGRGVSAGEPLQASLDVSPNPFNLTTAIRYTLPEAGMVKLVLYDVLGREAKRIEIPMQAAGVQVYNLNAVELSSGVYFLTLQTPARHLTTKLLLVK
ncbi:MAG: T9SS type A sorting domain-containing protein [Calditrichota bacterium]